MRIAAEIAKQGLQRGNRRGFGSLLHDDIHSFTPGYTLYESYSEWRIGVPGIVLINPQPQVLFRNCVDACCVLTAAAVKYRQCLVWPEA